MLNDDQILNQVLNTKNLLSKAKAQKKQMNKVILFAKEELAKSTVPDGMTLEEKTDKLNNMIQIAQDGILKIDGFVLDLEKKCKELGLEVIFETAKIMDEVF